MVRYLPFFLTIILGGHGFLLPKSAFSQVSLTQAEVESLRNQVQLMKRNQDVRPARIADIMGQGDVLRTATDSRAELRFNDGSLARIGEQAVFRFTPNTRTFQLSNGTVLLLIPPGQGRTRFQTPNAVAGIRGSGLFVRYIPETETTVVGALTDSGIEVFNEDGSQRQVLEGGQMAVLVQDRLEKVYNFDLDTFYRTSELVRQLNLTGTEESSGDEAIAAVQAETRDTLEKQSPLPEGEVLVNPESIQLQGDGTPDFPEVDFSGIDADLNLETSDTVFSAPASPVFNDDEEVRNLQVGGEIQSTNEREAIPEPPPMIPMMGGGVD